MYEAIINHVEECCHPERSEGSPYIVEIPRSRSTTVRGNGIINKHRHCEAAERLVEAIHFKCCGLPRPAKNAGLAMTINVAKSMLA